MIALTYAGYATCAHCNHQFYRGQGSTATLCPLCDTNIVNEAIRKAAAKQARQAAVPQRPCAYCGETFASTNERKIYCSDACRDRAGTVKRASDRNRQAMERMLVRRERAA